MGKRVKSIHQNHQGRVIEVRHPEFGSYRAEGVRDKLDAVRLAAKVWGVPWSRIARECVMYDAQV